MSLRTFILGALLCVGALACANTTATPGMEPTSTPSVEPRTVPALGPTSLPTQSANTRSGSTTINQPAITPEANVPAKPVASIANQGSSTDDTSASVSSFSPVAAFLPDAPERDLYRLTDELSSTEAATDSGPAVSIAETYAEGRIDTFWLINLSELEIYQSEFELRYVSPHAYWYFEEGQSAGQGDIEKAATVFEEQIYPRVTTTFGQEWTPGIDNDPHLNILNANLAGVGGYYSSADEYPLTVNKFSNLREIIYINSGSIRVGTSLYLETLAHELQHAIHWNADSSEDTWINEGLSELAVTVAGFDQNKRTRFSFSRPTSLVHWPLTPFSSGASYGAASLFMHYLSEHYGDRNDLIGLLEQPGDGIVGIDSYLLSAGHEVTFRDIFRDWAVANFLDEDQGLYGYGELAAVTAPTQRIGDFSEIESQIPQYSVEYIELDQKLINYDGQLRLTFKGQVESALLPVDVGSSGCWWGNSGDSIDARLSRSVDLSRHDRAFLNYQVWFELEEYWDYGYVEVSTNGGRTWEILKTPTTSSENPIGNNFGEGYTGDSKGWINERIDLSPYAGQEIQLRFQHITDDAVNGSGICLRGISIPEIGFVDSLESVEGWQADGFLPISNRVKQDYIVQVIRSQELGSDEENSVTQMNLDKANVGEVLVVAPRTGERLVVAVAALAPKTRIEATYSLSVEPAD